jgi:hypothetical protein
VSASGPISRALRTCGAIWLVAGVIELVLRFVSERIVSRIDEGVPFEEISSSLALVSWSSLGVHALTTIVLAILPGSWASTGAPRDRVLVQAGRGLFVLSLVLTLARTFALRGNLDEAEFEIIEYVNLAEFGTWYLAATLLVAGTRGPLVLRVGYGVLATARMGVAVWGHAADAPLELPQLPLMLFPAVLTVAGAAGLWLAGSSYADLEPKAQEATSDPARLRAAEGLALLRAVLLARILLAIASVALLVALRRSPEAAGAAAWLAALVQCGIAVAIWVALTRYASLGDDALERPSITIVIVCVTLGAVLEIYGAVLSGELLGYVAHAERANSMWSMPSFSELEQLQSRAQWVGRGATAIGLVAAVSLAHSLQRTARWLEDLGNARRAWTLMAVTILAGSTTLVLLAVAQSGMVESLGALAGVMAIALALALWILVAWLRLLSDLITTLRTVAED